jgi:hypothetical protein
MSWAEDNLDGEILEDYMNPKKETTEEELKKREINQAKNVLRKNGYFVENLWRIEDVKTRFKCDDETAQDILLRALTRGDVVTRTNEVIREISEEENLTEL